MQKKKVILVIQGEGRGHMTQALTVAGFLRKKNYDIAHIIVGISPFRNVPDFLQKAFSDRITQVHSPNFIRGSEEKSIKIWKSIIYNLFHFRRFYQSIKKIKRIVRKEKPELIINFYEPVFGLYKLFNFNKTHTISIAHQYIFLHPDFKFYKKDFWDVRALKTLTKITAIGSKKLLALHIAQMRSTKKIIVIPPLLRQEVLSATPTNNGFYCIYLLNHGFSKEIINWHQVNLNKEIHVFWDKVDAPKSLTMHGNLYFHKVNDQLFVEKLMNCDALLSTAGFESICEAAYLGKPVFMVPVAGHFEQQMNALMFTNAGFGTWAENFEIDKFASFINDFKSDLNIKEWFQQAEALFLKEIENI
jgi:uncharacterized protein (TIGR00661 family)